MVILWSCGIGFALEPNEIVVVANRDVAYSVQLARYYCEKRKVPAENIFLLSLGSRLNDSISRSDYDKSIAAPIRNVLSTRTSYEKIKCLVTTYGVPIRAGRRGTITGLEGKLEELKRMAAQEKESISQLEQKGLTESAEHKDRSVRLGQLQLEIDRITGKETDASVDSELSMVLFEPYELYRWQPNVLRRGLFDLGPRTMMVCRLDGPDYATAKGLVDKALAAEEKGLQGAIYIDSRGIFRKDLYGYFDQSLRDLALIARLRTNLVVIEETTEAVFAPGPAKTDPQAAIYCGWYSLKKYVDAFDFVEGAVGYHIASFEAANIRDPNSSQWCPAMLRDGITATLGSVAEPYLQSFPEPKAFFSELFDGSCLVETYYRTAPFNSWQLILIGDPLYSPFKKR